MTGINDVLIELNEVVSAGKYNSIRSADFFIKKINTKKLEAVFISDNEITEDGIQEPILEPVLVLESKEQPTFFEKIINWVGGLF